jgi:hypothetical protein
MAIRIQRLAIYLIAVAKYRKKTVAKHVKYYGYSIHLPKSEHKVKHFYAIMLVA